MTVIRGIALGVVLTALMALDMPAQASESQGGACERPSLPSLQAIRPGADRETIEKTYDEVLAFQRASRRYRLCLKAEDGERMERGTAALHQAAMQRERRVATEFNERLRAVHALSEQS
jgi:hypothetical protein